IRAVENVHPARMASFGNTLARLAIDDRVEKHHRARGIVVPDVVVHLLEVPDVLAGLGLQGHHRGAEQVIALAHRPVMIWSTVACREVDQPEFRIEGWCVPDRRPATHRMVSAGRPGITAELAGLRQGIRPPQEGAGRGIQGGEAPADPILPTRVATVYDTVVVERL